MFSKIPLKIIRIIGVCVGTPPQQLWFDHDDKEYDAKGWGFVFHLKGGWAIRPVVRAKWMIDKYVHKDPIPNPWTSYNPKFHFITKFWFPVLPFFSVAIGPYGFYIGFKEYDLDNPEKGDADLVGEEYAKPGAKALAFSISTRKTRWR